VKNSSIEDSEGDSLSSEKPEGSMASDILKLEALQPTARPGFKIRRLDPVVLQVTDLERSLLFYTQVLGFKVTEFYSEDLGPGGFAFLRCHWRLDQIGTRGYVRPASEWKGIRTLEATVAGPVIGLETGT
jgi:Glyoxalase/Bleomycin resistance protein/Dioxygenase superfamily